MAGLESIIQKIIDDATQKASSITENAKIKGEQIAKGAKKHISEKEETAKKLVAQTAKVRAERIIASAQLEGKKQYLAAKQALIDDVFSKSASKLAMLETAEYEKLISEMSKGIDGEVVLLSRDKEKGTGGGFIIKKGKVEYNFSFEALAKNAKEKLESDVISILFG
ncbi:MAG: V-type ATP synthase subunit E [Firmicutes bacterium]|nr:V-type ATP synthase subunit E [Bacillota bacterium]